MLFCWADTCNPVTHKVLYVVAGGRGCFSNREVFCCCIGRSALLHGCGADDLAWSWPSSVGPTPATWLRQVWKWVSAPEEGCLTLSTLAYLANLSTLRGGHIDPGLFIRDSSVFSHAITSKFFYRQPLMFTRCLHDIKLISQILFSLWFFENLKSDAQNLTSSECANLTFNTSSMIYWKLL